MEGCALTTNRSRRPGWLLRYSGMFLICALIYTGMLYAIRRMPIYNGDGYLQPYTVLGYVRQVVLRLLSGGGYRMVNFSLGQGMDALTTLSYYGYTDPLSLLAALFPERMLGYAFLLVDLLRSYLAGLCFGLYARKAGAKDGWAVACGALIYIFSGFMLYNMAKHVFFLDAAVYLPLVLLGVERLLQDRRWTGYALAVALMLVANFYFAYMNTVIVIVYIVVRLIARAPKRGLGGTARDGFMLLGGYLLGAALSAALFLPVVMAYLNNARKGLETGYSGSMLRYALSYYKRFFVNLFTIQGGVGYWTMPQYAPLALFGLAGLCAVRGARARQARIGVLLCGLGLCVPMVGRVMNGGAYVNNRWCYALAMFVALGCALGLPGMFRRENAGRRRAAAIVGLVYGAAVLVYWFMHRHSVMKLAGIAAVMLYALFLLVYDSGRLRLLTAANAKRLTALYLIATLAMYMGTRSRLDDYRGELMPWHVETADENATAADRIEADGVYRVDQMRSRDERAPLKGYMGTSFYWSMIDDDLGNYYSDLGVATQPYLDMVFDLGGSASMNAVAASRFVLLDEKNAGLIVPYGFEPADPVASPDGSEFKVYENRYALPLGYAYDAALSIDDYLAMPVEQKLQALTAYAICDSDAVPAAPAWDAPAAVAFEVGETSGVELSAGEAKVSEGGRVALKFSAAPDTETWLIADNLTTDADATFRVETARGLAEGCRVADGGKFYFPRPVTAVCLGGGDALEGCTLLFKEAATYRFDDFRVVSLPLETYRADVAARAGEALQGVELGDNRLSGRISVAGDRVLQIAVPYSRGWTARVDGAPAPVFKCGGMYMGVALTAGEHTVEMRYVTPGLRAGAAISLAALVALIALAIVSARRRRRAEAREKQTIQTEG